MRRMWNIPFLRNVFFASLLAAILVPCVVIGLIYPKFQGVLIQLVEDEAVRFTKHWAGWFDDVRGDLGPEMITGEILKETNILQKDLGARKVRVFSKWGDIIYSSDPKELGDRNTHDYFHEIVAQGGAYTKLVKKNEKSAEGKTVSAHVAEIYVPIMRNGQFWGALETYYDITRARDALSSLIRGSALLLIIVVFCMEGMIILLLLRAGRMVASLTDTEKKLRYEKEFGEAIFNSISDPIAVVDPLTYQVINANEAAYQQFGELLEPSRAAKCFEFTHNSTEPCSGANHTCPMVRTYQTGLPAYDEHIHYKPNGDISYEDVFTYPIKNEAGEVERVVHISRENRERKAAREEKMRLEAQLDRSRKMEAIGLLAGGVAHDLNNVLSGIVSYPDLLMLDCPEEDKAMRDSLAVIRDSGLRASAIVMDLLTLARRGVMEMEALNLNAVIQDYLNSPEYNKLHAYHPRLNVRFTPDPDLHNIKGSEVHLRKSVMNLVSNAAESMPHGGDVHISTMNSRMEESAAKDKGMEPGNYALLIVADNGIGMNEIELSRIFEPFYTKKKVGGSGAGLGMAVVWGTVQDHKGHIDVSSSPQKGTTFFLRFPATEDPIVQEPDDPAWEECLGNNESILVVEDVPQQQVLAKRVLEKLGYQVRLAESGPEALVILDSTPMDLVMVDTVLGTDMDGLDLLEKIKGMLPHQKAIITSGYFEAEVMEKARNLGVLQYVKKPYTTKNLGMAIRMEFDRKD
ncbi:Signal transduction histidine kinase [Desulfatibacillum alkenivorans DSM 16219]|uniref:histidine kinase n=1 Tax=Desulfatibacillum alkenivorans DSM 16219 TaxID=1121393 RepID=A0A1M6BZ13_9BACT|nr:PAS domain-containing sensor histidine kinase [Desulfatibacillum alkenivorans]SHI53831.1 Signal transduction histidine kinase [Desulfatibacillum alkenivorans DSM 16219]